MFHIVDGSRLIVGRNGQSAGDARWESGRRRCGAQKLQEVATACAHRVFPLRITLPVIARGSLLRTYCASVTLKL